MRVPLSSPAERVRNPLPNPSVTRVDTNAVPVAKRLARFKVEGSGDPTQLMPPDCIWSNKPVCGYATVACDCWNALATGLSKASLAVMGCGPKAPNWNALARMLEMSMLRLPLAGTEKFRRMKGVRL